MSWQVLQACDTAQHSPTTRTNNTQGEDFAHVSSKPEARRGSPYRGADPSAHGDETPILMTATTIERVQQELEAIQYQWGKQNHPLSQWLSILLEEVGEVAKENNDLLYERLSDDEKILILTNLKRELVQVMAVASQMFDATDHLLKWFPKETVAVYDTQLPLHETKLPWEQ